MSAAVVRAREDDHRQPRIVPRPLWISRARPRRPSARSISITSRSGPVLLQERLCRARRRRRTDEVDVEASQQRRRALCDTAGAGRARRPFAAVCRMFVRSSVLHAFSQDICPLLDTTHNRPGIFPGGEYRSRVRGYPGSSGGRSCDHAVRKRARHAECGRNGTGAARAGAAPRARDSRGDEVAPVERLKPSLTMPWPECPKGAIGSCFRHRVLLGGLRLRRRAGFDPARRHSGDPDDRCPHLRAGRRTSV